MVQGVVVLGMHIQSGVAYLGLVRESGVDTAALSKLALAANTDEWTALQQFAERLAADALSYGVVCLAVAETKKYEQWGYRDAYNRARLEVAAGLAMHHAGIEVRTVPQKTAATALKLAKNGDVPQQIAALLGVSPTRGDHWKERAPAFMVARHVLELLK